MTIKKERVTITIDPDTKTDVEAAAQELKLSFSAYMEKLAREDRLRRNGRKYREIMAGLPADDQAIIASLDRARAEMIVAHAS